MQSLLDMRAKVKEMYDKMGKNANSNDLEKINAALGKHLLY